MTELVEHGKLFIGGELADPLGSDVIEVISPTPRRSSAASRTRPRPMSTGPSPPPAGPSTRGPGRG